MNSKISALVAAALILGTASAASAATRYRPVQPEGYDVYAAPVAGSYGGYSADPRTWALERLADKYNGWSEFIR
jgi:hypothetical protein